MEEMDNVSMLQIHITDKCIFMNCTTQNFICTSFDEDSYLRWVGKVCETQK